MAFYASLGGVSRKTIWASNASTAWRWLLVMLGGIALGLRVLELVQHIAEPHVNRCGAVLDETVAGTGQGR